MPARPLNPRLKDAHTVTKRRLDDKMDNRDSGISGTGHDGPVVRACQPMWETTFARNSHAGLGRPVVCLPNEDFRRSLETFDESLRRTFQRFVSRIQYSHP